MQPTDSEVAQFRRQGYLLLRGFASQVEVALMRSAISDIIDAWELPSGSALLASLSLRNSTDEEPDHSFMLSSAAKAEVFIENTAVDMTTGTLLPGVSKRQAARKVAHALHRTPGPFHEFCSSAKVAAAASRLGLRRPMVAQSLYRLAPPLAAGVDRHQDSTMLYTEPPSCLGFWLALEDSDEANGCLRVRAGSHREPIRERLVRRDDPEGGGVRLVFEEQGNNSEAPPPLDVFTPLPVLAGDLLVMHGALEHVSFSGMNPNRSRESFQLHIVDAEARWPPENWLQYPPDIPFTLLAPPALAPSVEL